MLALLQIANDIRSFLVILLMVMFGFGSMFFLASMPPPADGRRLDEDADAPSGEADDEAEIGDAFGAPVETIVSVYRLMLGDFDREWFPRPLTLVMFLAYTFIANIMMLNVLIAVVSDSYANAMIKSEVLFRRARLELIAEFDTMFSALPVPSFLAAAMRCCGGGDDDGASGYAQLGGGGAVARKRGGIWTAIARSIRMRRGGEGGEDGEDEDGGEEWKGAALDMERRVALLIAESEKRSRAELDARLAASEARIIDALRRMQRK